MRMTFARKNSRGHIHDILSQRIFLIKIVLSEENQDIYDNRRSTQPFDARRLAGGRTITEH